MKSYVIPQRMACVHPRQSVEGVSERVPRDSQTSALSGSVRSTSDFAVSVPARIKCLAQPYSSDVASWMRTLVPAWRSVKPSGPAQLRAVWVAQQHAHAGLLSRRQEAGPDHGNEIDLRQIQSFRLHGDTERGVLKRSSDHMAIIVVQTGSGQSEKRNTPHAQQLGNCTSVQG